MSSEASRRASSSTWDRWPLGATGSHPPSWTNKPRRVRPWPPTPASCRDPCRTRMHPVDAGVGEESRTQVNRLRFQGRRSSFIIKRSRITDQSGLEQTRGCGDRRQCGRIAGGQGGTLRKNGGGFYADTVENELCCTLQPILLNQVSRKWTKQIPLNREKTACKSWRRCCPTCDWRGPVPRVEGLVTVNEEMADDSTANPQMAPAGTSQNTTSKCPINTGQGAPGQVWKCKLQVR